MGLLSILAAISSYSWQRYVDNANLKTATREVMADIASCKQRAVSEGIPYCLQFTDGSPNYTINASSCAAPTQTVAKNLGNFGTGLTVSNTNFNADRVSFLSRGTLQTNTGDITVANGRNSTATITINITGRTYVQYNMQ